MKQRAHVAKSLLARIPPKLPTGTGFYSLLSGISQRYKMFRCIWMMAQPRSPDDLTWQYYVDAKEHIGHKMEPYRTSRAKGLSSSPSISPSETYLQIELEPPHNGTSQTKPR